MDRKKEFREGLKSGIPIGLGYFPVSFALGITGVGEGLTWWEITMISLFNLTSAGQFAAIGIISTSGTLLELALSQLIINLRYSLMSITLTQRVDDTIRGKWRFIVPFSNTDEIFALGSSRDGMVTRPYWLGLSLLPIAGWTLGTAFGGLLGSVLPDRLLDAVGIAIYAMFIAIITPAAKKSRASLTAVLLGAGLSCLFYFAPGLRDISSGFSVIICAVVAAAITALLFPVTDEEEEA